MKFLRFALPIAIVMAAMVAAAPAGQSPAQSLSTAKQQIVSIADSASSQLQTQDAKLKQLSASSVTADDMKPITQQVVEIVNTAGSKLNEALKQIQSASGDADKRQALLVPAISQLVTDLNVVLADAEPLLRHLTTNLELGTVQDLVDGLTPALATLIAGVEALLVALAPGLSTIVDPLLHTVYGLTDTLGLPLNLPSIPASN